MPAGDPGSYMKQGMSQQQAMQKAGVSGGFGSGGAITRNPIQRPPNQVGQAGGGGAVQNLMAQFRRIVTELQKVGALGMAKAEMDKIGGGAPVSPKPAMPGRAVAGGARPMGGAPSGMTGGPVPKPGGMAGGPPRPGMM